MDYTLRKGKLQMKSYRMPVTHYCCEEGILVTWSYTKADSLKDAKKDFMDGYEPDIESSPDFSAIEEYNEETEEWL